jgi:hypothetical protein
MGADLRFLSNQFKHEHYRTEVGIDQAQDVFHLLQAQVSLDTVKAQLDSALKRLASSDSSAEHYIRELTDRNERQAVEIGALKEKLDKRTRELELASSGKRPSSASMRWSSATVASRSSCRP